VFADKGPLRRAPWLLAASLVPFFLLALFTHPAADDFVYAAWAEDLGLVGVQQFWYVNWCGRYTATLVQTGFPLAVDMTRAYPLVPLALLAGWVVSLAAFLAALEGSLRQPLLPQLRQKDGLGGPHSALSTQHSALSTQYPALSTQDSVPSAQYSVLSTQYSVLSTQYPGDSGAHRGGVEAPGCGRPVWVLTAAFAAIYVTQMPRVCEGFYWLAGGATYQLALILTLLVLALAFSARPGGSRLLLALEASAAALLALAAAGCNETMLPLVSLILLVGAMVSWKRKHPGRWVWTAALAAYVVGSLAVVLAPGNALRSAQFADKPPPAICLAMCAWDTIRHALKWSIRPMPLGLSILGIPLATDVLKRAAWAEKIATRHVVLSAAATVGVVFLSFAPAYLSIGRNPPARAENVSYFFFLAGWFATWLLAVARFRNVRGREPRLSARTLALGRVALVAGVLVIGNLPRAVYDLAFLAPAYDRQLRQRYALLRQRAAAGDGEVVVERLAARPKSISFGDVGDEPSQNERIARYFGVSALVIAEHGAARR